MVISQMTSDESGTAGDQNVLIHKGFFSFRSTLAGFSATTAKSGTSRVTTLPAPTIAYFPIVTPQRIVEPEPIVAPFLTRIPSNFQVFSRDFLAVGYRSLIKTVLWPTKTSSSITTPEQIEAWL